MQAPSPLLSGTDPPPRKPLFAWRCCRCGNLLARVWLPAGAIIEDVTCARCGEQQGRRAA